MEVVYLDGDVPLVVVHGQHDVEFATDGAIEDGVRRVRPARRDAAGAGAFHRRGDGVYLLIAEQAALAAVWIDRRHRDARVFNAPARQAVVAQAQLGEHVVPGYEARRLDERLVRGKMHHAQARRHQHGGGGGRAGEAGENLLMADVVDVAGGVNRLLVQGARHHGGDLAGHRRSGAAFHRQHRRGAAGGGDGAHLEIHIARRRHVHMFAVRQGQAALFDAEGKGPFRAIHDDIGGRPPRRMQRLHRHFRADAGRVAQGEADARHKSSVAATVRPNPSKPTNSTSRPARMRSRDTPRSRRICAPTPTSNQ